jgi:hypothetical protein
MLNQTRHFKLLLLAALAALPAAASADLLQSSHFRLDPNVASSFGGASNSTSYKLTDTGGEAVVGAGSSQSYRLGQGYVRELPQSLQLSVLPSGTYASWPFNTGAGPTAYDVGSNSDDATLNGSPGWTTGIIGSAVALNGSSQYVSTSTLVTNPTAFTIEFWFKSTSSSGGYLMGFGSARTGASANLDRLVYLTNAGNLAFGVKPSSYQTVTTASAYNDGSWHHVAASLGASGLLLYVDGLKQGSDTSITTAASYSGYWRFGYDDLTGWPAAPMSNYAAATIDEARVTGRQLRDAEVAGDYSAGANALQNGFTLPSITPGTSQTYAVDAIVRTDAGGYDLYMQRPRPLLHTDNSTTIPDISGTFASPIAWVEGTTKGFGFTLTAGTQLESSWGSSPNYNYARLTSAATLYHSRTGFTQGLPEATTIQYRADTAPEQKQGTYSTTITYTATIKP